MKKNVVECDGTKVLIEQIRGESVNDIPRNVYRDPDTMDVWDADTIPPVGKGHTYTAVARMTYRNQGRIFDNDDPVYLVTNKLRAWDEESMPLLDTCGALPAQVVANSTMKKTISGLRPGAVKESVLIPAATFAHFLSVGESEGWDITVAEWDKDTQWEAEELLKRVEGGDKSDESVEELRRLAVIAANTDDPGYMDDAGRRLSLRPVVAKIEAALRGRKVSKRDRIRYAEFLLGEMRKAFDWAKEAHLEGATIVVTLQKGTLRMDADAIAYQSEELFDSKAAIPAQGSRLSRLAKKSGSVS